VLGLEFTDDDIQIERRIGELIDRGLECYGAGDMEGALAQWKHALALDPDNERAANYLEYVEDHHDLAGDPEAAGSESTVELAYPFGISTLGLAKLTDQELDDYESFEILEAAPKGLDTHEQPSIPKPSVDDGWNVDEGWVADLVQKSETAFTPSPPEDLPSQTDIATIDVSLSDGMGLSGDVGFSSDIELSGDVDLSGDDVDLSGDDVDLSGDDVDLSGDDVDLSGDDVDLSGDDVDLASDDVDLSDDADLASDVDLAADVDLSDDADLSREPRAGTKGDEGVQTHVHRPSAKIRSLAGFDELELDSSADDPEHAPEQDEEEEQTHALLGAKPASGPHVAPYAANELELELDEEEENTQFHESANRVGVSHTAATSDFADLELDGLSLGASGGGTETSASDLRFRIPGGRGGLGDSEATIDFASSPASEEISIDGLDDLENDPVEDHSVDDDPVEDHPVDDDPVEDHREESGREENDSVEMTIGLGGDAADLNRTTKHFAIDEEMTIDRSSISVRPSHSRAPTQDHNISRASISVDDALLSLQDSTRELDLGDMGLSLPGDEPEPSPSDALEEVDIRIGRSSELETAPGSEHGEREFARHDSATEATDDGILAEITRDAPRDDVGERVLYIVTRLIDHADEEFVEGRGAKAASDVCHALDYAADSAVAQKVIFENERRLVQILISSLGDAGQVPRLMCPLSEIPPEHINHRAAFLLTRLEQAMTLDELLDVSGMPKLEALRHLCGLHVLHYLEVV